MVARQQALPADGLVPAIFAPGVSCLTRPVWLHGLTDNYVFTLLQVFSVFRQIVKICSKMSPKPYFKLKTLYYSMITKLTGPD
jgi:hypothetical protein